MMQLELGSSAPAAFFRGLMLIFLTLAVSGIVLNIHGFAGRNLRYFQPAAPPEVRWGDLASSKDSRLFLLSSSDFPETGIGILQHLRFLPDRDILSVDYR